MLFGAYRGQKISLPNVEITFEDMEYKIGKKVITKTEPLYYTYSIFSLFDFANVTIYHLHKNKKPILCCVNCKKFFIPDSHVDENTLSKTIIEKNDRLTCCQECNAERKSKKTETNLFGYKRIKKNICDNLRKKKKLSELETFNNEFQNKEKSVLQKYGNESIELIEEKMTKFMLEQKEKYYTRKKK